MRRRYASIALCMFIGLGTAHAEVCSNDTLQVVDVSNQTGTSGVLIGPHPAGTLSLNNPRQRASSLSGGRISASATLNVDYMHGAAAHASASAHGVYMLVGPAFPTPVTVTATLRLVANSTGLDYYQCQSNDPCMVPPGVCEASITEGAANAASYRHDTEGRDTTAISVTLTRVAGQTFELGLRCAAFADFAGNIWLDVGSYRTADVSGTLSFSGLPAGYSVVPWQGCPGALLELPLCLAPGDQLSPVIVSDQAGGGIVIWRDSWTTGGELHGQRMSEAGALLWAENGVPLGTAPQSQYFPPAVVSDGSSGAIVSWLDASRIELIAAQRISAAGVPLWPSGGVTLSDSPSPKYLPTMISDGAGGAIITWFDHQAATSRFDVRAQHINAAGAVLWAPDGVFVGPGPSSPQAPVIAPDGAGGAIISWCDDRGGLPTAIYSQRIGGDGVPQWATNGVSLCSAPGSRFSPAITTDGAGGAIVSWHDLRSGTSDLYAQRIDSQGLPQWTPNGVLLCTSASFYGPRIATDGAGGACIAWIDRRGIYAQRIDGAGVPRWAAEGVSLGPPGFGEPGPAIAPDGLGGAIVTWTAGLGDGPSIHAQHISAGGSLQWPDGRVVAVSTGLLMNSSDGRFPVITGDGAGGAIIAWQDFSNGTNYDIYAARVSAGSSDQTPPTVRVLSPNGGEMVYPGQSMTIGWEASDDVGVQSVNVYVSRSGTGGPWEAIAQGVPNSGAHQWTVDGASSNHQAFVRVDAWDAAGNKGSDLSDAAFAIASGPVPTLVELFRLEDTDAGVAIIWSVGDPSPVASLSAQRRAGDAGDWSDVPGEPVREGRLQRLVDRDAIPGATSWYRLAGVLRDGRQYIESPLSIVHAGAARFALERLAPNPVGARTQVSYSLPQTVRVRLSLVDVQGREVGLLADAERAAGRHVALLDVSDLHAGLYFLCLRAGRDELRQRLIVVR
mgnify:CR=1 FL=1